MKPSLSLAGSLVGSLGLVAILLLPSCSKQAPEYLSEEGKKGWKVYQKECTICHHQNPNLPGLTNPSGPAITGSSEELVSMRVLKGKYPKGYTAKQEGNSMTVLPHLKNDIGVLTKYLQESVGKN